MSITGVSIRRFLKAPASRVFAAWTRPELMARWLFPESAWTAVVAADVRVGGRYELSMQDPAGVRHSQFGTYRIATTATKAYEVLSTQVGYRGWWNAAGTVAEEVGGSARLRFVKDGQPVNMTFRIDELAANERVRWTCTAHDIDLWVGTTLAWTIRADGDSTVVALEHAGWPDSPPEPVVQGWKHFLGSLRSFLETGAGQPW